MKYPSIKRLLTAVTVLSALTTSLQANANEEQLCGSTTTTGNALTLDQQECTSGNGLYFYVDIDNNDTALQITTTGGTGQTDILTSTEGWATGSRNDIYTNNPGTEEQVDLVANAGRLYITLYGLHEQVSFKVKDTTPVEGMCGDDTLSGYPLTLDQQECISGNGLYYYLEVEEDNTDVTIETFDGTGDADIFVNPGKWATRARNTASSENDGTDNSLTVNSDAGRLYISIFGINEQVSLKVTAAAGDEGLGDYITIDKNVDVTIPASTLTSADEFSAVVNEIIASTWSDWTAIAASTPDPISDVADAIHFLAQEDDINSVALDQLVYFLRNYNFNGPVNDFSQDEALRLSNALHAVAQMTDFHTTAAPIGLIQEGYATAIANLTNSPASDYFVEHLPHLLALVQYYSELTSPYDNANFGYSSNQLLKVIYDAAFKAQSNNALNSAFNDNMLSIISALRTYGLGETGLDLRWSEDEDRKWILGHLFIALGNVSKIVDDSTKARIDSIIIEIFDNVTSDISIETAKEEITATYLETIDRTCDANDALSEYCTARPTVDDILSTTYQCSANITIRSQGMSEEQLIDSCAKMAAVEDKFHNFFVTNNIPVNDDLNTKLEVIVYATPEDYETYGYEFFGHSTNNGGIYLEGDPSVAGNIARFHAMQCPDNWAPYSCVAGGDVYNLEHEFVHYLDGRYNLYGSFSYHDNTVSWAEGWAEFISKDAGNPRNLNSVVGENIPALYNILFMNYGFDNLYPWSYLAMQYLSEQRPDDVLVLASALRDSDTALYQAQLTNITETDGDGFLNWAAANTDAVAPPPQIIPAANTFGSCDLVYQYARYWETSASVSVTNTTDTPVTLYWVNNSTGEVNFDSPYQTLEQGETYSATYWAKNDRLMVADQLKNCLGVAVLTETGTEVENTYTIDAAMVENAITEEIIPAADILGSCDLLNRYDRLADGAAITITNTTDNEVNLFWVNYSTGEPNLSNNYKTLNNGDSYTADFWAQGDRMMIADSNDTCIAVAVLTQAVNTYTIDDSLFESTDGSGDGSSTGEATGTDADLYIGHDGQSLVNQIVTNSMDNISDLFQITGVNASQVFSNENISAVLAAIETRATSYDGIDGQAIPELIYFLRAAYYVEFYSDDVAAFSADIESQIISALTILFNNESTWTVSNENAAVLQGGLILVDSTNLGAHFNDVTIRVLTDYNDQWQASRAMNNAANSVFTTLYRGQWDDKMKALFTADDSILDALNNFQLNHRDALGTDAEYVLVNSVRELSRLYHVEAIVPRVKAMVKGVIDSTNKDDETKVLWLAAASMADFYDRADCGYYEICGFAYQLEKDTLSFNYKCSDTLKIRAQDLYNDQADWICGVLGEQEINFHQTLETLNIPVADDNNSALELVIFDSSDEYQTYAGQFFGINTNNGGMYLEGAPIDEKNQARFIAYEAEWKKPEFHVWNLQHEYVHYLDARYNLFGDFSHGMSVDTVWWTEGLAEYISQRNGNDRAVSVGESQEFALSEIFKNDYNSGQDRIYRWGYLAVRFMFENHRDDIDQMLSYLRNDQLNDYQTLVDSISTNYDSQWFEWLVSDLPTDDSGIVEFGPNDVDSASSGQAGNWAGEPVTISTDFSPCVVTVEENKHNTENNRVEFNDIIECVNSSGNGASFVIANSDALSSNLTITTSGGWGNADIQYKADGWPSAQDNDGIANGDGNDDSLTIPLDNSIYWHYITLKGEFGGIKLELTTSE